METPGQTLHGVLQTIENAAKLAGRPAGVKLLAVSKTRSAAEVAALAGAGQRAFGENYVQEGVAKARELAHLGLEWHLVGHLQSNKAREAATWFDWVESVDRPKLVKALDEARPAGRPPLDVLIQVNVDDEASKSGCAPADVPALAAAIAAAPRLRLRGLMAIPAPAPDPEQRRASFRALRRLFDALASSHPGVDTLSMGMSDDFPLAIAEGATLVRIGTALFGPRGQDLPKEPG
ncbi:MULTISPECIES: YggS family pyridoxal phosphate-dependent enzyme [unclassified Arenimonas]|uniref:YggS family pyridoxal phosphate-dependent enzyme n=1 Tax=unclassified Arenimonas TaxID=2641713 RepID=UPI000868A43E|nr:MULTISPECIES: YggS family pyridoxal phosphate-dependent enzyme [unclassified Arenimonas]ODS62940.1 MAG: YggS family pyridoxal phosphate enzyme [Arenimonas sp. SCN 70-307]